MSERLLYWTSFAHCRDNVADSRDVTWEEMLRRLTRHRVWANKDGELWSPTEYRPGAKRGNEGVLTVHALVLDFDDGSRPADHWDRWQDLAYVLHSTWSNSEDHPKWRAVFPLRAPVPADKWPEVWRRGVYHLVGAEGVDESCKDASRIFYLPSHPPGAEEDAFALVAAGYWLDWEALPAPPPLSRIKGMFVNPETGELIDPAALRKSVPTGGQPGLQELAERALAEAAKKSRHRGAIFYATQARDNGYSLGEAAAGAPYYLARVGTTNSKGKEEPFTQEEMARALIWAYGKQAREPWGRGQETHARPPAPAGGRLPGDPPATSEPEKATGPDILEDEFREPTGEEILKTIYTAHFLKTRKLDPLEVIVAGLFTVGLYLIHGHSKLGKSFIAVDTAAGVALGGKVLGHFDASPGRVLYVAREDGPRRLKSRLSALLTDEAEWPENLHIAHDWPPMDGRGFELLGAWMKAYPDTKAVILDPWTALRPTHTRGGDIVMEDRRPLERLDRIGHRYGVLFLVIHHSAQHEKGDALNNASGSSGVVQPATGVYQFSRKRGEHEGVLQGAPKDTPEINYTLRREERTGFWAVAGDTEELTSSRSRLLVYDYLAENGPARPKALTQALGLNYNNVKALCVRMERDGEIQGEGGTYRAVRRPGTRSGLFPGLE